MSPAQCPLDRGHAGQAEGHTFQPEVSEVTFHLHRSAGTSNKLVELVLTH